MQSTHEELLASLTAGVVAAGDEHIRQHSAASHTDLYGLMLLQSRGMVCHSLFSNTACSRPSYTSCDCLSL